MKAGHQLTGPASLSQRTSVVPPVAATSAPLMGCAAYRDHAMPGHRVCVLSDDCQAFTGAPVPPGTEFTVAAGLRRRWSRPLSVAP